MTRLHAALVDERKEVDVDSGKLTYLERGSGKPVVFVHGVFLSSLLWAPAMEHLSPHHRYIAIDLPAHGHSDAFEGTLLDIHSCAVLLLEGIARLGLTGVHLVGNDSGGAICQVMVTLDPQRFSSLVLTNCDTHGNIPPQGFTSIVELAAAGGLVEILALMQQTPDMVRSESGFGSNLEDPSILTDAYVAAFLDPVIASAVKQRQLQSLVGSFSPSDLGGRTDEALHNLDLPSLIAWGDSDPLFGPEWGIDLATKLGARAKHVSIPGAKFLYPFERPAAFAELLHEHLHANP